ncbi:MAG: 16S rRNA (adenine(1518)-N(6)/adenine(1519)-N(6))-dimethyltransferase RsmA [Candidatus Hydrogenedentota bacterium]
MPEPAESHEPARAPTLRELCARYSIRFKKGLGQNLLLDPNINRIMVEAAALTREDSAVEVGAGLGALTRLIAQRAGRMLAVEIDYAFMPCLEDQFGGMEHVHLFRGDILNHELDKLLSEYLPGADRLTMLSNLPYYITTPILFQFLESPRHFQRMVVMMQAEVAQRLVAPVNADNYGVLSLAARLYADVDIVHHVPASCFVPRPKVDSCIVRFRCHERIRGDDPYARFTIKLVRAAFSQRRKTLRNSLVKSGNFGVAPEVVSAALEEAGIDPARRPQTVELEEFGRLAAAIRQRL